MKRVGIVCAAGMVSGKEIMSLELARGLRARGHAVDVATSVWGDGEFSRRLAEQGFTAHRMRLGFISATLDFENQRMTAVQMAYWPALLRAYRRFVKAGSLERIVHTNWQHLLLLWPLLRADRELFWVHDAVPATSRYGRMLRVLDRRLRGFVAVSRAVARSLEAVGVPAGRIRVVYNGIEDPCGGAREAAAGPIRIGIVGQVAPHKGHVDVVAAFARVASQIDAAELHVFGIGPADFQAALRRDIDDAGLAGRVHWHGFVADRRRVFESLSLCVVPSRFDEPFGLVAIEAAFAGLPVVATRRGGLTEIVEDGVTGFLVESEDPEALADRILALCADREMRAAFGQAARARAAARFGQARFIDEFAHVLEGEPLA